MELMVKEKEKKSTKYDNQANILMDVTFVNGHTSFAHNAFFPHQ